MQGDINFHFFVNSVAFISSIIKKSQLPPGLFRVVCSNNNMNKKKLGEGVEISTTSSPSKKFNFYTSTVFEGSDILDMNGYTIVVSDGNSEGRIIDISTSMKQICGRIRDSKYKNRVTYICPFPKKLELSWEEYKAFIDKELENTRAGIERINKLEEKDRLWEIDLVKKGLNDTCIFINKESKLEVDTNKYMLDLYNYKKRCELLGKDLNLQQTFSSQNYIVSEIDHVPHERTPSLKLLAGTSTRKCFKDYFEEYVQLMEKREGENSLAYHFSSLFNLEEERHQVLAKEYPLVKEAYEKLGVDKVKKMKYKTSNIKRELGKLANIPDARRVVDYIKKRYALPVKLEVSSWREILNHIYHVELGLQESARAKATDLDKWFITRYGYFNQDGKTVDAMTVIREKSIMEEGTKVGE